MSKEARENITAILDDAAQLALSLVSPVTFPAASLLSRAVGTAVDKTIGNHGKDKSFLPGVSGEAGQESTSHLVYRLKEAVAEMINSIIEQNGFDRFAIFIDNLDRLNPVTAVGLLEGIKNFVDLENCVFVIAVDRSIVDQGVAIKYGYGVGASEDADNEGGYEKQHYFFDKVIQLPFSLPVARYDIDDYIGGLLKGAPNWKTDEARSAFAKRCSRAVREVLGDNNPRTIKRALNLWELYRGIDEQLSTSAENAGAADKALRDEDDLFWLFAILLFRIKIERISSSSRAYDELVERLSKLELSGEVTNESKTDAANLVAELYANPLYAGLLQTLDVYLDASPESQETDTGIGLEDESFKNLCAFTIYITDASKRLSLGTANGTSFSKGLDYNALSSGDGETLRLLCDELARRYKPRPLERQIDFLSNDVVDSHVVCSMRMSSKSANLVFYFLRELDGEDGEAKRLFPKDGSDTPKFYYSSNKTGKYWYGTLAGIDNDSNWESVWSVVEDLLKACRAEVPAVVGG